MDNKENIEKKLTHSFFKVSAIMAAAALLGLIAMVVISNRYSYALENYGFAQGDIGKAMFEFADIRSSLRAAIGYDNQEAIDTVVKQHDEKRILFDEYFAEVENTIVSKDGRETYDEIKGELDAYWKLDGEIMELGATTDNAQSQIAQEMALNQLTTAYNSIYGKLEELLNVKVHGGNSLSKALTIAEWILIAVIIVVIVISVLFSIKIGKKIARQISNPLGELGQRLKTFATGDLSSPFPMVETGDEVEHMEKDATEMADNLNTIIHDIGEVLGEMSDGNYVVRSKHSDKYTGDFQKLYVSMRKLRDQMTETLLSIGRARSPSPR